ncbi:GIY-YIG nuclease family protein [Psychrosphaera sp. B3R10]|uniref:GIY-YIG nuclease family protein n=1 Tax=Psychrosphaera sp. B3R10 TaxID=2841569 RepID=UPI001C096772|nr:GIY-YIG nuclease family protein [Psychrosphaera sp. B3R10]MBU2989912.1 GIY-YIG nuclease family protein [Psychrosphaera sp. B3R10]
MKAPAVYIITNAHNTTLYIGVTSNIQARIYQHKHKLTKSFSNKYNLTKLVYFEQYEEMRDAILREKSLKKWKRIWKEDLITQFNPHWVDLYSSIL